MKTKTTKLKVMTILGTRPEIIRLSCILPMLDRYANHTVVYTNQNYDYNLSGIFFDELGLRKPDHILDVRSKTLGGQIAKIIEQSEAVLWQKRPDALLVLGDTNSSLSAIVAKRMKIPIFHMEAGNRAFDWNVPEEVNRRILDHISDFNLAYTEHARKYLLREGIAPDKIFVVGSPLLEVIDKHKEKIDFSEILKHLGVISKNYFLVSIHREENVDNEDNLRELFFSLNHIAQVFHLPVIVSFHPRTEKRFTRAKIKLSPLIKLEKPFGYFDYNKLQRDALCVLSDSGTIQEESAIQGFRAIQVRESTERPEAFDSGSIILTGFNKDSLINAITLLIDLDKRGEPISIPEDYKEKNVSTKVTKLILGLGSIYKNKKR